MSKEFYAPAPGVVDFLAEEKLSKANPATTRTPKPLPWEWVHAILTHYLELFERGIGGKITWQEIGGGFRRDVSAETLWLCTIQCKLERCPREPGASMSVVEKILHAEANAAELRNRLEETERMIRRGGSYFDWLRPEAARLARQIKAVQREIDRLRSLRVGAESMYDAGMAKLAEEFAKCAEDDHGFLRGVKGLR